MSKQRRDERDRKRQERLRQELERQAKLYQATRTKPLATAIRQAVLDKASR